MWTSEMARGTVTTRMTKYRMRYAESFQKSGKASRRHSLKTYTDDDAAAPAEIMPVRCCGAGRDHEIEYISIVSYVEQVCCP
jgi:hypothetical protein